MSSVLTRRRLGALTAAVAAGAAITAPSALGAPGNQVPVASGATDLHLNAATAGVLTDAGLSVAPVGPATAKGLRVSFPITGGNIDPFDGRGPGRPLRGPGLHVARHHRATHQLRGPHHGGPGADRRRRRGAHPPRVDRPVEGLRDPSRLRRHRHLGRPGAGEPDSRGGRRPQRRLRHGHSGWRQHRPGRPQGPALSGAPEGRRHHARARRRHRRGADVARRGPLGDRARDLRGVGSALPDHLRASRGQDLRRDDRPLRGHRPHRRRDQGRAEELPHQHHG